MTRRSARPPITWCAPASGGWSWSRARRPIAPSGSSPAAISSRRTRRGSTNRSFARRPSTSGSDSGRSLEEPQPSELSRREDAVDLGDLPVVVELELEDEAPSEPAGRGSVFDDERREPVEGADLSADRL